MDKFCSAITAFTSIIVIIGSHFKIKEQREKITVLTDKVAVCDE